MNPIYEFVSLIQLNWIKLDETHHFESRRLFSVPHSSFLSSPGGASSAQSLDVGDQRHLGVDGCGRHLDDGWRPPGPGWPRVFLEKHFLGVDGRKSRIYVME